jgi:hypothetical protein
MDEKERTAPQGEGRKRIQILDSDDVATVERKLRERFPRISESAETKATFHSDYVGPGRPPADWHADAVDQIDKLVAAGTNVRKAVRSIAGNFAREYNVSEDSIRVMYYEFKERRRHEKYESFVVHFAVNGQFSKAAHAWFDLDERQRKEFNSKL